MAVGVSSSQSLRVQVGARYRDQDPDRASSRGRCLLAPGMSYLTHRAAPLQILGVVEGYTQASWFAAPLPLASARRLDSLRTLQTVSYFFRSPGHTTQFAP